MPHGRTAMVPGPEKPSDPGRHDARKWPHLTRVRLSALGTARCPNLVGREGVIVGSGRNPGTVRIMFDGSRTAVSLHSTYIEAVAPL
jgi:hypothetical protein